MKRAPSLESQQRAALRARAKQLRAELAQLKASKRSRIAHVRATAKAGVKRARESMRALRTSLRAALRAEAAIRPFVAKGAARAGAQDVKRTKRELRERAGTLRSELRQAKAGTAAQVAARARALERRHEKEDFILQDIPSELHPVFRRVRTQLASAGRGKYAPSERMSAAEGFMHWVHDHPGDVVRMLDEDAERSAAAAFYELTHLGRAMKSRTPAAHAALPVVPF